MTPRDRHCLLHSHLLRAAPRARACTGRKPGPWRRVAWFLQTGRRSLGGEAGASCSALVQMRCGPKLESGGRFGSIVGSMVNTLTGRRQRMTYEVRNG
jgi:hypothetical protein